MKGKARIGRTVLFCEMGNAEEKGRGDLSKIRLKSDAKWGEQEKRRFRGEKDGVEEKRKMGFNADFAML